MSGRHRRQSLRRKPQGRLGRRLFSLPPSGAGSATRPTPGEAGASWHLNLRTAHAVHLELRFLPKHSAVLGPRAGRRGRPPAVPTDPATPTPRPGVRAWPAPVPRLSPNKKTKHRPRKTRWTLRVGQLSSRVSTRRVALAGPPTALWSAPRPMPAAVGSGSFSSPGDRPPSVWRSHRAAMRWESGRAHRPSAPAHSSQPGRGPSRRPGRRSAQTHGRYTRAHACTHVHTHTRAHMHTHTCTHVHTHAHALTCTHTHMHAHAYTHLHVCTHACTHTCTHTCAHTLMHTLAFLASLQRDRNPWPGDEVQAA